MNWQDVGVTFEKLFNSIGDFVESGAIDGLVVGFQAFVTIVRDTLAGLSGLINTISTVADWLGLKMPASVDQGTQSMSDSFGQVPPEIRSHMDVMQNEVWSGVNDSADDAGKLGPKAEDAVGPTEGILEKAGESLVQGFINGMSGSVFGVAQAAKNLVSTARQYFPFSPAKVGPFSGKGYTLYSGMALAEDWAKGIEQGSHQGVRAVESMMATTNQAATAQWNGHITSDDYGIRNALSGMSWTLDRHGGQVMAKVVNESNAKNARR